VRKPGVTVMVVVALMLGGCTTSAVRPTGVVTGVADACEGHPVPPGEVLHVKVSLDSRSTVVASTTIRSGARYRFSAVPGEYRVTGWWGSRSVAVRAGRAVTANFASDCV
jgi:major membrane immunogen (membrane-anchored lipoprotein)